FWAAALRTVSAHNTRSSRFKWSPKYPCARNERRTLRSKQLGHQQRKLVVSMSRVRSSVNLSGQPEVLPLNRFVFAMLASGCICTTDLNTPCHLIRANPDGGA